MVSGKGNAEGSGDDNDEGYGESSGGLVVNARRNWVIRESNGGEL